MLRYIMHMAVTAITTGILQTWGCSRKVICKLKQWTCSSPQAAFPNLCTIFETCALPKSVLEPEDCCWRARISLTCWRTRTF